MHGGARAGRPKGVGNLLTHELRDKINGTSCINFLQELVDGKIRSASINERKDAAIALLKKILPDSNKVETELSNKGEHPVLTIITGSNPYEKDKKA